MSPVILALAAFAGAAFGSWLGRGAAMDSRLEPIRVALADMADRFDHATRRWRKRDSDADLHDGDTDPQRQRRLRQIALTVARRKDG